MEITETMRAWKETYVPVSYDVGPGETVRLSRLLFWMQETAERHLEQFDIGYDRLRAAGMVFLTAKTWLRIDRMPHLGETVELRTAPSGVKGAQFLRSYTVFADGNICAESVQSSVIADAASHRILHPDAFIRLGFDPACGTPAAMIPKKLRLAEQPQLGVRTIRYSDLDYNSHLSNAVYGDFVTDFVPGGMQGKRLTELQINYVNEALEGDDVVMHGSLAEDGTFLFYGDHSRGRSFDVLAHFG